MGGVRAEGTTSTTPDSGATLVEIIVSCLVLAVGLLLVFGVISGATQSLWHSKQRQLATAEASRVLEAARSLPYLDVAERSTTTTAPYDPDGPDGVLAAEPVHQSASGAIAAAPYMAVTGSRTLTTHVTRPQPAGPLRRVTAVVTWSINGSTREVRASTLISDVPRVVP